MSAKVVRTICFDCHSKCGVLLHVEGNNIVKVEGDPHHPISEGILCVKAFSAQEIHSHPDRLKYPMKRVGPRGSGQWERISWEEALDTTVEQIKKTRGEHGPQAIVTPQGTGRGSNHFHSRFQSTIGIPGFSLSPTHVCLLPNLAQTHVTYGRMLHPHEAGDYRNAGCIVMWGTNPVFARQYTGLRVLQGKRKGAKLIVIDPEMIDLAARADVWLPVRPGSDGALAMGFSHLVIKNKAYGRDLLSKWTNSVFLLTPYGDRLLRASDVKPDASPEDEFNFVVWDKKRNTTAIWLPGEKAYEIPDVEPALEGGYEVTFADGSSGHCKTAFQAYAEQLEWYTPERVAEITWVPKEKILKAYDLMVSSKPTLVAAYLGACMMTTNALQNGRAITCLQLLLDVPLDEKGGLLFNKFWEFMLSPKITLAPEGKSFPRLGDNKYPMYTQVYGQSNHPDSTWDALITAKPWPVQVMVTIASDLLNCYENAQKVYDALLSPHLKLHVVQDYFMTPTAQLADIVLPAAHWSERVGAFDEELYPDPCPAVIPQKAVEPPGEARDDWYTYRELGKRLDPEKWPWNSSEEMWLWRLKEFHNVDLTWEEAVKQAYIIRYGGEKRIFKQHEKGLVEFQTPSMRIELYSEPFESYGYKPLPVYEEPMESPYSEPGKAKEYPLILTTGGRDVMFYHSGLTNIARLREIEPYPYAKINDQDARELGISDGEWVFVESPRGKIEVKAKVIKALRKGVVKLPRQTYKDACKELGLPGYGWDKANPNILIPAEPADPGFSCPPMRCTLCRVTKKP
jgi:anaerobic selenocysteine-containing dehydrogenase